MVAEDLAQNGDNEVDSKESAAAEENRDAEMAGHPPEDPPEEAKQPRKWKFAVIFLCFYGFMASIKPGEPFITPYLLSNEKNFTRKQVTNEITPVLTYSYMAVLVPAFLLTDFLRYKPVLIIQGFSQVSIWLILLLGTTLLEMQFMEFFYGITMACRVAYSSYIFSLVSPVLYQKVAGYSRSSVLLGVFISSTFGQICMLNGITYYTLSAISLGFVSFGLLLSLCLPLPKRSLFFNRSKNQDQRELAGSAATNGELDKINSTEGGTPKSASPSTGVMCWSDSVFVQMLSELRHVMRMPSLRLWSLWWIFNSTGYYLVLFYVHILWNKVHPVTKTTEVYNGGVEAVSTLLKYGWKSYDFKNDKYHLKLYRIHRHAVMPMDVVMTYFDSAGTSFIAGFVKIRWNVWSELVIGVITALQASLLLVMYKTSNIWFCYMAYVLFRCIYQFLVPIATFQIASSLTKELCALVFGINTFLGTILKSIINLIFSDKRGLGLDVHSQFLVYFIYFALLTVIYFISAAVVIVRHYRNQPNEGGGANEKTSSTELSPVAVSPEDDPLSNDKTIKT